MLGLGPNRTAIPAQEFREFIHRSIDTPSCRPMPGLPISRFPCGFARSRPGRGLGDSGLDHYPCTERAGAWRRVELAWVLAAAIAGALLGDGSAFWIGHRAQREILNSWPMANYPRVIQAERSVLSPLGRAGGVLSRASCRRSAPSLPITAGALDMSPTALFRSSTSRRSCYGHQRTCCRGSGGIGAAPIRRDSAPYRIGKHYWMLSVIGGALVVALAVWIIRRRHGGGLIEPAPKRIRKDIR